MKINISKNKQVALTVGVIFLIGVAIILITPAPRKPATSEIPVTPSPTKSIPISLNIINPNPKQKLVINWNNLSLNVPQSLPAYEVNSSVISLELAQNIAKRFGLNESDLKKTMLSTSILYSRDNLSVFGSTVQDQIQYRNDSPLSQAVGITNLENIRAKANEFITSEIPNISYIPIDPVEYFYQSNTEYPQKTTASKANLVRLSYQQKINNLPILSPSTNNASLVFTFDSKENIRSVEITGGFKTLTQSASLNLMNFSTLQKLAPRLASAINFQATTDITSEIEAALENALDLTDLKLGYMTASQGKMVIPVFILNGTITSKEKVVVPSTYIVPAQY